MTFDAPHVRPLDAERERLRVEGWSEAKIDEILMRREIEGRSSPPPRAAAATGTTTVTGGVVGQGGMSGVLNNLSMAIGLVTGFLPSLATDIANLFGAPSSLHQRSRAGVFLAAKLAFLIAVGFAIYQEWERHIVYEIEIARQQAEKARIVSCAERMEAAGKLMSGEVLTGGRAVLGGGGVRQRTRIEESPELKQLHADCDVYSGVSSVPETPPIQQSVVPPTRDEVLAAYAEMEGVCQYDTKKPASAEQLTRCRAAIAKAKIAHEQHSAWWNFWGADESPIWPLLIAFLVFIAVCLGLFIQGFIQGCLRLLARPQSHA